VAPETLPFAGGETADVEALAVELAALPDIEGLTFSGGEPMSQANALCRLIDRLRERRSLSFVCYTGHTLGWLRRNGTDSQRALLHRLDVLIDGAYVRERHTDLRWRGSDNQQVWFLTPRYRDLPETVNERGTWIEFEVADGTVRWMGIPPRQFREAFTQSMKQLGIDLLGGQQDHEWLT
jgi:anaerobic ribonucleoside-triphosphate reductase activating protein